jgi:hypothetical protein
VTIEDIATSDGLKAIAATADDRLDGIEATILALRRELEAAIDDGTVDPAPLGGYRDALMLDRERVAQELRAIDAIASALRRGDRALALELATRAALTSRAARPVRRPLRRASTACRSAGRRAPR